jgi:undecaprenyl-diphosphatase
MNIQKRLILTSLLPLTLFIIILINLSNLSIIIKLDSTINYLISEIARNTPIQIAKIIGLIFDPIYFIFIALLISLIIYLKYSKKQAIFFALTNIIGAAILYLIKEIVQRARPLNALVNETSFSFPSGHATMAMIFFGLLIYFLLNSNKSKVLKSQLTILGIILILIISFSRIYLNAHWFTDVLAGLALGSFILFSSITIKKILY